MHSFLINKHIFPIKKSKHIETLYIESEKDK
jgi:hypothetical protein